MDFFYFFIVTLLHSIWQAALLMCIYLFISLVGKNYHPIQKRNFLYLLLFAQFSISIITLFGFLNHSNFETTSGFLDYFQVDQLPFLKNYYPLVFTVYMSIVIIKIVQIIFQWASFKTKHKAQLKRPTADLKIFTAYHSNLLSIKKTVTLWFSNAVQTPVTFGFVKPVILFPVSLVNNISAEQAELIILHELIHIKSKDYLLNWFLLAMETIYFFNPFIKIVAEKLKLEREKNCDIQVLNYQYGRLPYAETLYKIAQNQTELKSFQLGFFQNNAQLFERISFFSKEHNLCFKKSNFYFLSLIIALFIGFISFVMLAKVDLEPNNIDLVATMPVQDVYQKKMIYASLPEDKNLVGVKKKNQNKKILYSPIEDEVSLPVRSMEHAEELTENFYTPVSYNETIDSTKEVIYNVETKNTTITQSYKLVKKNGIWLFEPLWMIVEKRPDSLQVKDSISTSAN